MVKKSLLYVGSLFLFSISLAAQVTVFGPLKISPGLQASKHNTYQFQTSHENTDAILILKAGTGEDLTKEKCQGTLPKVAACQLSNLARVLEVKLTRPASIEVYLNDKVLEAIS